MNRPSSLSILFALLFWAVGTSSSLANGLDRNGVGAVSSGKGGTAVTSAEDGFAGMSVNPALLGLTEDRQFWIGATGVAADGSYLSGAGNRGSLVENAGLMGEAALLIPLNEKIGLGFSIIPNSSRLADWFYLDEPGGIDGATSYGRRTHKSEIITARLAAGLGIKLTDRLAVGASLGGVYNRNQLESPYTFQRQPTVAGFKTMLDLETEGWGLNADFGLTFAITENLDFGLSYRTPTTIDTSGHAEGDIGAQFESLGLGALASDFRYDAEVENELPQILTAGLGLQVSDRTRVEFQVEWIDWGSAFDSLPIHLTNGTNTTINSVVGDSSLEDSVPLNWDDTFVTRIGVEHWLCDYFALRAGYSYGSSPVSKENLLPMTAAISEHTLSLGCGIQKENWSLNLSYQYDLPAVANTGDSAILSGEYDGSRVEMEAHWISLSVGIQF